MIPLDYPLLDDLGLPQGERVARQNWAANARWRRKLTRRTAIGACLAWILMLAFSGMIGWMVQRVSSPGRLSQHLNSRMPMGNAHLGAEYYNIAQALVDGRGFSDPFKAESGATAWMPPLLVWGQASLIWIFDGDRYRVMWVVVALKTLVLMLCSVAIIQLRRNAIWAVLAALVVAFFTMTEFHACFAFTHDSWLILAGVTATLFGLVKIESLSLTRSFTMSQAVAWGLMGGVVALSSPIAGYTWAVGTSIVLAWRMPQRWIIAGLVSVAVVTPWALRNKIVLGKFVPVKSNLFFEIDQSFALDSDGLLDWNTMSTHPYHTGPEQDKYKQLGEIEYVQLKKERFLKQVQGDPTGFLRRVRNRFIGVTLWPAGFDEFRMPSLTLPFRWLLYPIPALAMIALLIWGRPLSPMQRWAMIVYVLYLIPYVLFSYYPRYGVPLLPIKMMFCCWALESVIRRRRLNQQALGYE